jgi:hypothetical protein
VFIIAGSGAEGYLDGPANLATFSSPASLVFNKTDKSLYVADYKKIRKISADGMPSI